jgi:hypothetical protein
MFVRFQLRFGARRASCCAAGIEDMFRTFRRLVSKGTENRIVSLPRLHHIGLHAARGAFPGTHQDSRADRKAIRCLCIVIAKQSRQECARSGPKMCPEVELVEAVFEFVNSSEFVLRCRSGTGVPRTQSLDSGRFFGTGRPTCSISSE